jgi:hypothetical protein
MMKNLVPVILILFCPLVLNNCDIKLLNMDEFPAIEWEMGPIDTSVLDLQGKAYISFRPSIEFKNKDITYFEKYPLPSPLVALDAHRLVYINEKSLSGVRGRGVADPYSYRLVIFPDDLLETGDVITFSRDWFCMRVSEYNAHFGQKSEWYKVRIVTESIMVP